MRIPAVSVLFCFKTLNYYRAYSCLVLVSSFIHRSHKWQFGKHSVLFTLLREREEQSKLITKPPSLPAACICMCAINDNRLCHYVFSCFIFSCINFDYVFVCLRLCSCFRLCYNSFTLTCLLKLKNRCSWQLCSILTFCFYPFHIYVSIRSIQ